MSSYVRAYIKACEGFGWTGGPGFNTRIRGMANGRERRNANWDQPQHFYSLPFLNLLQSQYAPIATMFLNRKGRWGCFLYVDRRDDRAEDELFAVAEPGQDTFQLSKWSIVDGVGFSNTIHALYVPDPDSPGEALQSDITITVNGVPTADFTVDPDTGVVVFDTPFTGGDVLRWSGYFSRWVRFDNDRLPFSIDNKSGGEFVLNGTVELLEMPPPDDGEVSS